MGVCSAPCSYLNVLPPNTHLLIPPTTLLLIPRLHHSQYCQRDMPSCFFPLTQVSLLRLLLFQQSAPAPRPLEGLSIASGTTHPQTWPFSFVLTRNSLLLNYLKFQIVFKKSTALSMPAQHLTKAGLRPWEAPGAANTIGSSSSVWNSR